MALEITYDAYRYIFIIGAIAAGVTLLAAILLFFLQNIPRVIGDLSGITAKKAIRNIREQNEKTGEKSYQPSQVNRARSKLTDKIAEDGRVIPNMGANGGFSTTKIGPPTGRTDGGDQTTLLADETSVLANETSVLAENAAPAPAAQTPNLTTVLNTQPRPVSSETTVLSNNAPAQDMNMTVVLPQNIIFSVEYEITLVHSDEIIA